MGAKKKAAPPTRSRRGTPRSMGRLERILLLVPYCVRHPGVSTEELAGRFGVSKREIVEDLDLLFMCGLPDYTPADLIEVFIDEDRVYVQMADYFARPLRLTRTEAIPLYLKANALLDLLSGGREEGVEELSSLRSALEKLGAALLPQEGGLAELTKRIRVHLESGEARWLSDLREAVTKGRRVEMEYYTYSRDDLTERKVDPYLVFASMGHWYTSGYCHLAQDRRMFRLDRIKSLELTDETFETPEDAAADMPSVLYEPSSEDVRVTVRVAGPVGDWIAEYYPVESDERLKDGWRELRFRTSAFAWLDKLLLRLGKDVEVVEPPELADRLREGAERILALYAPRKKKR